MTNIQVISDQMMSDQTILSHESTDIITNIYVVKDQELLTNT